MTTSNTQTAFPCPRCGKASFWLNNPSRPFCSEQCKLIDLGAWANEDYKILTQDASSPSHAEDDYDD